MFEYDTVKVKGTAVQLRAFSTLWSTQDGAAFLLLPNELLEITGCPPRPPHHHQHQSLLSRTH